MKQILLLSFLLCRMMQAEAQPSFPSAANAHAHNDYEGAFPFWEAWKNGFGSIETDIFLHNGKLIVAHDSTQLLRQWTLDSLYLQPLVRCIQSNKGAVYPDSKKALQLMIDIKSDSVATLQQLIADIKRYPSLINTQTLRFVISGNRPPAETFSSYPAWIHFDGDLRKSYTPEQMTRLPMLSGNFKNYSTWNGKGRMVEKERLLVESLIERAHQQGKTIRFWNAPDNLNSWYEFIERGVDYINTDRIFEISAFFKNLPARQYQQPLPHKMYQPKRRNDGTMKPVKNVILLIGDGTGLAQWQAASTANKGALNVFNMRYTGLSKTSSFDSYITDSAPGATAFSAGVKTNNRSVGVDHTGKKLLLLPQILAERKIQTGIITTGDLRDATPAAFYAHQPERSSFDAIFDDLLQGPVQLLIGSLAMKGKDSVKAGESRFRFFSSIADLPHTSVKPVVVAEAKAALPAAAGRGGWASEAFKRSVKLLSKNSKGFFLVVEGAQVDRGGHANQLPLVVSELLDLDKVVGEAMAFADSNGETLVIVTGDHETGGLTLTAGDSEKGLISGQFSTDDHTAIPVPVFAYGPQAHLFTGVYENTAIFEKIRRAFR